MYYSDIIPAPLNVKRQNQVIEHDEKRVICRLFMNEKNPSRVNNIVHRILQLDDEQSDFLLKCFINKYSPRHKDLRESFIRHYRQIQTFVSVEKYASLNEKRKLLIGAYFTMEYAIESVGLLNPSIVLHPDQSGVDEGCRRFIMSFRAVGEGHLSSLVFRSGMVQRNGEVTFDPASSYVNTPDQLHSVYNRNQFLLKLKVMGKDSEVSKYLLKRLPEEFTLDELKEEIHNLSENPKFPDEEQQRYFHHILRLAESNYQVQFTADSDLSERVIFPVSEEEKSGIENARFVQFYGENGETLYYGTYTAYDGNSTLPQLIETRDFRKFKVQTLNGKAVKNKGMALFPRKINGKYAMLSRQDGENIHIMFSNHVNFWEESNIIQRPSRPWEFIKLGNCGSPIETSEGWLVLTHGVGPVREYSVGAILLDLQNPTRVIARLDEPLLKAQANERSGYTPNVVYTCGALVHHDRLIIPYAVADTQPALASVKVDELIGAMKEV